MKTLTLVRHAKSSWHDTNLSDRERPLNKRGLRDAPIMARRAVEVGIRPSLIVASPAVRAWTTAKIFAMELGYPVEFLQREDDIYLASLDRLLDVVASQDTGFNHLMLFGHNPGLTDFANYLSPGLTNNLPTAGIVSVEFDRDDWMLFEKPAIELLVYDYPKKQL
jgi:phosphohistidine phosphatase